MMKKTSQLILLILTIVLFTALKKHDSRQIKSNEKVYTINPEDTKVTWTAYKTTEKVAVTGSFTALIIENIKSGATAREALNGINFKLPVDNIFSQSTLRDSKIKKFFFGTMLNTEAIEGTISLENSTSGYVRISMNAISHDLPISYKVNGHTVTMEAVLNLDNWKAQLALEALNDACEDLHAGSDGISKTWSEVKIDVVAHLKYE
jgi:hypothetical protein